ncbi:DUF6011 domain-containing protein [Streptosporangium canum]
MATSTDQEPANCLRCGRLLRSAKSIGDGMGRTCKAKVATAAKTIDLADFKPAQQAKATEVIEQGGILPTSRPHLYRAVSSDGTTTYLVAAQSCTCPAGIKGRRCYHVAAVRILLAAHTSRRAA